MPALNHAPFAESTALPLSSTIVANIELHSKAAPTYVSAEPHYRPENRRQVRRKLEEARQLCGRDMRGGGRMLDIGCGAGFIIDLAKDLFDEVHGVDVTPAMLDRVDASSGNVFLHRAAAEKTPFDDQHFDLVSAYSFLHHCEDFNAVLREAHRILQPGGVMYIDLEPNKLFWEHVAAAETATVSSSKLVRKAIAALTQTYSRIERELDLPENTMVRAEPLKDQLGKQELERTVGELGFSQCRFRYQWFLGQGEVMHDQSFETAEIIEDYLHSAAPLTDHLFKYWQAVLVK